MNQVEIYVKVKFRWMRFDIGTVEKTFKRELPIKEPIPRGTRLIDINEFGAQIKVTAL
jgi:hypothetical protein